MAALLGTWVLRVCMRVASTGVEMADILIRQKGLGDSMIAIGDRNGKSVCLI